MFVRRDVPIKLDGSAIEVQMICGFAQHLDFDCELFDTQGNNPQLVVRGSNLDSDPPPFAINVVPPQLKGRFALITATVQSLGGNNFNVEAVFRQGSGEIARLVATGTFQDHKTLSLVGRFV
jgi:hypothetical protein